MALDVDRNLSSKDGDRSAPDVEPLPNGAGRAPGRTRRALWIHSDADPLQSGELRRLGLPALMVEAADWTSTFTASSRVMERGPADVVVCALRAMDALPQLASGGAPVIVEVDSGCIDAPSPASVLHALANRVAGVVARSPRVAQWAERVLAGGEAPVWVIPDVAARAAELTAARLRFGLASPGAEDGEAFRRGPELWFSEPGDAIIDDEVEGLKTWDPGDGAAVVIAPPAVRAWLAQAGVRFQGFDWSPERLLAAVQASRRCVFFGNPTWAQFRRRAVALRLGGVVAAAEGGAMPQNAPLAVGDAWADVLAYVTAPPPSLEEAGEVLVFLDLVQDIDLMLPLLDAMRERGLTHRVVVSSWLRRRSPRVSAELEARGLEPEIVSREAIVAGQAPDLAGVGAVLTPAESSLSAHERAHALFRRARAAKVPTLSLQHGVENVGLARLEHEPDDATLLSDHLFVWFPREAAPSTVSPTLGPRLRHVGRSLGVPARVNDLVGALADFRSIAAVFENLHWERYTRAWRMQFLSDCLEFAAMDPDRCVVLKPHHGGLWSTRHTHLFPHWPRNLVLADPTDSFWEPFTAPSLLQLADLVITTPSTVALDAVQAGKPVAVASYGLDLPAYAPLTLLHSLQDWLTFAAAGSSTADAQRRSAFLVRTAWGEDPTGHIIDHLSGAMRERAASRRRQGSGEALA